MLTKTSSNKANIRFRGKHIDELTVEELREAFLQKLSRVFPHLLTDITEDVHQKATWKIWEGVWEEAGLNEDDTDST